VCLGCGLSLRQLWLSKEKRGQWGRWDREFGGGSEVDTKEFLTI